MTVPGVLSVTAPLKVLPLLLAALVAVGPEDAGESGGDQEGVQEAPSESALQIASEERFVLANSSYEDGDYGRAIELYESLLAEGLGNGFLHYDLGNAYLRNGELGRAIAAYRRSQLALPRNSDVAANLEFARRSARDAIEPPAPPALSSTLFFWHYGLSRAELLRLAFGLNLLFWSALALRLYRRQSEALRWLCVGVLVVLVAVAGSLLVHWVRPSRVAVIVPQEIDVHSGTSADTVVRFKLHAGTEVRATEVRNGWISILLPSGERGWISGEHAELVEPRGPLS